MLKLRDGLVVLYKKVATSLPPDVEAALREAHGAEQEDSGARRTLSLILENVKLSRDTARPICQDTGVPVFMVKAPAGLRRKDIVETIVDATRVATETVPLRPNAVDVLTERNTGDNTGTGFPIVYFEESPDSTLRVDLTLKGSGCENQGRTYRLPVLDLGAERDLQGVRKCILDAVWQAQGGGCPPYTLGVGIGAANDQVAVLARQQLFRKIPDRSPSQALAALEERLLGELNELGIGPLGLGGRSTALGVKVGVNHRHMASYFVSVSLCCWANRRGTLIW